LAKPTIHIIGGGTAALFLAAKLNTQIAEVIIYERHKTLGRKFLVAGDGGLNLSYEEHTEDMQKRYTPSDFFDTCAPFLGSDALRHWFLELGIETYVGTSKRVFPKKGIKPNHVLQTIINHLRMKGVQIRTEHIWKGFSKNKRPLIEHLGKTNELTEGKIIFALGGSSWSVTGSEGEWLPYFASQGISTKAFQASNCAFEIKWEEEIKTKVAGSSLKNIAIKCGDKIVLGEITLTNFGIEGSGVYPLSPQIRNQLNDKNKATIFLDLKPMWSFQKLLERCNQSKANLSETLTSEVRLPKVALILLKHYLSKEEFTNRATLARYIKEFPITISHLAPMDEAISTIGGIDLKAVKENFELKEMTGYYCIGEMLDWDAPTGGYLISACYAQASVLAEELIPNTNK
jgi:uncharacterized flavoprotein (TIGR03862 family)